MHRRRHLRSYVGSQSRGRRLVFFFFHQQFYLNSSGIAAVDFIKTGHGHVNYNVIPSVVYTHPEIAWVGKTEQDLKKEGVSYNVGKFSFHGQLSCQDQLGHGRVRQNLDTDRILGAHIIGPNAGEMIAEGVLAIEYGASAEDVARTTHAHVCFFSLPSY